jgi:hypothetical protein
MSALLIFIILCCGIDIDRTPTNAFWDKLGIKDPQNRMDYVLKNYEILIYRGPFPIIANMVLVQLEKGGKPTRGIFWDALHSIYLIYTDYFFTSDEHFKKMRESYEHPIFKRINFVNADDWFIARKFDIDDEKTIASR